ncbi:MAG: DUF4215 domain-containing protein, partial [Deltaproteobacteria bacterium]|nr:DUF4215 domain-containing protein [Deltaproteobacteria bacterium]
ETGYTCTGSAPSVCSTTCGDGIKAGTEACDDHNTTNGDGCSSTCAVEAGWTCTGSAPSTCSAAACGDGIVAGSEQCDDKNTNTCGTCPSTTCAAAPLTPAPATGTITVPSAGFNLSKFDGDTFVLNDGISSAKTFQLWLTGSTGTNVKVDITGAADQNAVATIIASAINGVAGFHIAASVDGTNANQVDLTENSSLGNHTITATNPGSNTALSVTGMLGGVANDCGSTIGCSGSGDCRPGLTCTSGTCQ